MTTTSIQIDSATRKKLARLKSTSRETYDQVLNKLLALIPEGDDVESRRLPRRRAPRP